MGFEEARQHTRNATIAAIIMAALGLAFAIFSGMTGGNDFISVADVPGVILAMILYVALGIGVYFYSRVSAILLFLIYALDKIIVWVEIGRPTGIIIALIILFYLGKGIGGAFAYHKLRKEADPDYKSTKWWMWLIGIPSALLLMIVIALGSFMMMIDSPETSIQTGAELGPEKIQSLRDADIIEEDEEVIYFYSEDIFSILNAGNILTDKRLISYETVDGIDLYSSTFDNILDFEIYEEGSFFLDTTVYVYLEEGDDFFLLLSVEGGKDQLFLEALRQRIPERTELLGIIDENAA